LGFVITSFSHRFKDNKYNVLRTSDAPRPIKSFAKKTSFNRLPTISNTATFAQQFRDWWISLQPAWRQKTSTGRKKAAVASATALPLHKAALPNNGSWGELRKGGPAGCCIILYALCGWLKEVCDAKDRKAWHVCADDVKWVLEHVA
jgi:hypothetical protein